MEIILHGQQYVTTSKLDAFTQLHIARKLGPAIPIIDGLVQPENADKDKNLLTVLMLAHINDDATEYVIRKCMSVVSRRQNANQLAKIQTSDGSLMFDDITMADLLELTIAVIEENLGDFFRTALGNLEQAQVSAT